MAATIQETSILLPETCPPRPLAKGIEQTQRCFAIQAKLASDGSILPAWQRLHDEIERLERNLAIWTEFEAWVAANLGAKRNTYPTKDRETGLTYSENQAFLGAKDGLGRRTVYSRSDAWDRYRKAKAASTISRKIDPASPASEDFLDPTAEYHRAKLKQAIPRISEAYGLSREEFAKKIETQVELERMNPDGIDERFRLYVIICQIRSAFGFDPIDYARLCSPDFPADWASHESALVMGAATYLDLRRAEKRDGVTLIPDQIRPAFEKYCQGAGLNPSDPFANYQEIVNRLRERS